MAIRLFHHNSLWSVVVPPAIWIVHFLVCYIAAAILCAKVGSDSASDFDMLRLVIAIVTAVASAAILYSGIQSVDDWREALDAEWDADANTLQMRRKFVGRAAFLLSGLSAIGVLYTALPILFISSCK